MNDEPLGADTLASLHAAVTDETGRLEAVHAARLHCRKGCSACCVDGLTVFDVEAAHIRRHHAEFLAAGVPHAKGACAFLGEDDACRIYDERPYVCRTQGLPLRWVEERDESPVELRDICPLNDAGTPIENLSAEACWTLGPTEERLALLQIRTGARPQRIALRDLFGSASNGSNGQSPATSPLSARSEPQGSTHMGDKSPKAKDKSKKQHAADKNHKQAAAVAKAAPAPARPSKK